MIYSVYANIEKKDLGPISRHRTMENAGKAYQAAHTGNLRRVVNDKGKDVTRAVCDAYNRVSEPK